MRNYLKTAAAIIFSAMVSLPAYAAGGISLGATRVIYPADAQQTSLSISNIGDKERFLVNPWI